MKTSKKLFKVYHETFATDRYETTFTIVKAVSERHAYSKFNEYIESQGENYYDNKKCENLKNVSPLQYLS